jgi:hypothetical protein
VSNQKSTFVDERLFIPKKETETLESDILRRRHIERYAVARQFVYGRTADLACGCGYGTYILSKNPDVTEAIGIDMSDEAIAFATKEYGSDRVSYVNGNPTDVKLGLLDTMVSIETIEHLEDPKMLNTFAEHHAVETLVVSFPIKKTTHYNKFHRWDLKTQDVIDIFYNFTMHREFMFQYDTCFVCMVRHHRPGTTEKRWRSADGA